MEDGLVDTAALRQPLVSQLPQEGVCTFPLGSSGWARLCARVLEDLEYFHRASSDVDGGHIAVGYPYSLLEWRAQIEKFIAAAGKKPTYLDSHHHSSYFTPALFQTMLELAQEYDVPIRMPLAEASKSTMDGIPEPLAASMLEAAPRLLAQFQPRSADGFFVTFYDEGATREELLRILNRLPES